MEKELKISELAKLWGCSVPTTWNRINKEGLTTIKKKDIDNKNISYVTISDDIIKKYLEDDFNNVYKGVNNVYYEDMLKVNNVNNEVYKDVNNVYEDIVNAEIVHEDNVSASNIIERLTTLNKDYNEDLKKVYEDYNKDIKELYKELTTYKVSHKLLEDKKASEGYVLQEYNELKKVVKNKENIINKKEKTIKWLLSIIIIFIMCFITFITYFITVNINVNNSSDITFTNAIESEINR